MSDFDKAFNLVLGSEGNYVNDPKDPGGETKWGISKRSYPSLDIKNLSVEQAKAIYREDFWNALQADKLPWPLSFDLFDFAVNSGKSVAVKCLQRAFKLTEDGILGPQTVKAVQGWNNEKRALFYAERALYLASLKNFSVYGRGWMKRCFLNCM